MFISKVFGHSNYNLVFETLDQELEAIPGAAPCCTVTGDFNTLLQQ